MEKNLRFRINQGAVHDLDYRSFTLGDTPCIFFSPTVINSLRVGANRGQRSHRQLRITSGTGQASEQTSIR